MSTIIPANILKWTPEYSVHFAEIDREHQSLFGLVNRLHEAMLAGRGREILGSLLAELTKYTMNHFANEEKLMAAVHYPEMFAHIQLHEGLRRRVKEVGARFERGETAITIEVTLFLSDWLKKHVMVADSRLGDYIQVEKNFTAYLDRLLQGDLRGCGLIVQHFLAEGISLRNLYVNLFQRSLYRTGELWMKNRISVATEHLATTITESMMTLVHPTLLDSPRNGKRVLITCVCGESHQLGARMVSDTFECLGWEAFFLGANTPVEGLLNLIGEKQPDVLCLSVSLSSHIGQFKETVKKTRCLFPELDILAGGQAFQPDGFEVVHDTHLRYLRSLDDLETWIASR
jgi:hemerythrin-like metal-binding protein